MEKKYFENYGWLEYLEPEDFYAGNWRIVGRVADENSNSKSYTLVLSGDKTEYRYSTI